MDKRAIRVSLSINKAEREISSPMSIKGCPVPLIEEHLVPKLKGLLPGRSYFIDSEIATETGDFFAKMRIFMLPENRPLITSGEGFSYMPGMYARNTVKIEMRRLLMRWADRGQHVRVFIPVCNAAIFPNELDDLLEWLKICENYSKRSNNDFFVTLVYPQFLQSDVLSKIKGFSRVKTASYNPSHKYFHNSLWLAERTDNNKYEVVVTSYHPFCSSDSKFSLESFAFLFSEKVSTEEIIQHLDSPAWKPENISP